jgi:hypothetical protein
LRARPGGVLGRAGHTEASVDISRLAGLNPSGVICEIMSESGEMARLPELVEFAKKHNLKIAQIADLIRYRRKHERVVQRKATTKINSVHGGEFELNLYVNNVTYAEHIALVKGDISDAEPVLTRVHALNATGKERMAASCRPQCGRLARRGVALLFSSVNRAPIRFHRLLQSLSSSMAGTEMLCVRKSQNLLTTLICVTMVLAHRSCLILAFAI